MRSDPNVGTLFYGGEPASLAFPDALLAHIQVVTSTKLRRGESFILTWRHTLADPPGKTTIWLQPAIPLRFVYDTDPPHLNPVVLRRFLEAATTSDGLVIDVSADLSAMSQPHRTEISAPQHAAHTRQSHPSSHTGTALPLLSPSGGRGLSWAR